MGELIKTLQTKPYLSPHNIFAWIVILLPPTVYFYLVCLYSLNIPFADDFANLVDAIHIIQATTFNEKFSHFIALHNEHRIVFNRLVHTLFYFIFGEVDFRFLAIFGNIALVALLYLFYKILSVPHSKPLYFIPVSILLFQLQSWENMTWAASALQNQYILVFIPKQVRFAKNFFL
jgi:hypothetical protein